MPFSQSHASCNRTARYTLRTHHCNSSGKGNVWGVVLFCVSASPWRKHEPSPQQQCRGPFLGWKKNFQTHSGEKRKVMSEEVSGAACVFALTSESRARRCGCVCFYGPGREGGSQDTPADLLAGWSKRGLTAHLLVGWRSMLRPMGRGVGHIRLPVGAGRRRPGCSKGGRGSGTL